MAKVSGKVSGVGEKEIRANWGKRPEDVAEAAFGECLEQEVCSDYDDQIATAFLVGILVGETKGGDVESFIQRLEAEILSDEEPDEDPDAGE